MAIAPISATLLPPVPTAVQPIQTQSLNERSAAAEALAAQLVQTPSVQTQPVQPQTVAPAPLPTQPLSTQPIETQPVVTAPVPAAFDPAGTQAAQAPLAPPQPFAAQPAPATPLAAQPLAPQALSAQASSTITPAPAQPAQSAFEPVQTAQTAQASPLATPTTAATQTVQTPLTPAQTAQAQAVQPQSAQVTPAPVQPAATPPAPAAAAAVNTALAVYTAEPPPPPTAANAPLPYAQSGERFTQLANVALDETGTYSLAERIEAQQTATGLIAQGRLRGIDTEGAQLTERLNADDLSVRQQELEQGMTAAVTNATANGQLVSVASYDYFTSLSEADQQILFNLSINVPDQTGRQAYPSVEAYRQQSLLNIANEAQWWLNRPGQSSASPEQLGQVLETLRTQPVGGDDRTLMDQLTQQFRSQTEAATAQNAAAALMPEGPAEASTTPLLRPGLLTNMAV